MRPWVDSRRGPSTLMPTATLLLFLGYLGTTGVLPESAHAEGSSPEASAQDDAQAGPIFDGASDFEASADRGGIDANRSTGQTHGPGSGPDLAYVLGADDVLAILVSEEPDLTGDFTIATDGTILYAYAGRVEAAGSTVAELEERLEDLLGQEYLQRRPRVTVAVKEYRSQMVRVLGDVGKPGTYPLRGPMLLSELLDLAEGITGQLHNPARRRRAQVWIPSGDRGSTPTAPTLEVDLYALLVERHAELDLPLTAGSVVFVPEAAEERPTVVVLGEVLDPGPVFHEPGLTVLEAVSRAGGPTARAARKKRALVVTVQRLREGEIVEVRVGMNDVLEAGDILSLPVSFW